MKFHKGDQIRLIDQPERVFDVILDSNKTENNREFVTIRGVDIFGDEKVWVDLAEDFELVSENESNKMMMQKYNCQYCKINFFIESDTKPNCCPICGDSRWLV
jgi:rubrerythrin